MFFSTNDPLLHNYKFDRKPSILIFIAALIVIISVLVLASDKNGVMNEKPAVSIEK